jgi:hypothetical protein
VTGGERNLLLDGTTLHNLEEILTNAVDPKVAGPLWSNINFQSHRMDRECFLRKADIDRRLDTVEELVANLWTRPPRGQNRSWR